MLKKIIAGGLLIAIPVVAWQSTKVLAISEQVRDAWIESQRRQTLDDWDVHARRQLRKLDAQQRQLERRAHNETVEATIAARRHERLARRYQEAALLVAAVKQQPDERMLIGAVQLPPELAQAQKERLERELEGLREQVEVLAAQQKAHSEAAAEFRAASQRAGAQRKALGERVEELTRRRQIERARQRVRASQRRPRLDESAADELVSLCELAEQELDRAEAVRQLEREQRPARTRSLDQLLER